MRRAQLRTVLSQILAAPVSLIAGAILKRAAKSLRSKLNWTKHWWPQNGIWIDTLNFGSSLWLPGNPRRNRSTSLETCIFSSTEYYRFWLPGIIILACFLFPWAFSPGIVCMISDCCCSRHRFPDSLCRIRIPNTCQRFRLWPWLALVNRQGKSQWLKNGPLRNWEREMEEKFNSLS